MEQGILLFCLIGMFAVIVVFCLKREYQQRKYLSAVTPIILLKVTKDSTNIDLELRAFLEKFSGGFPAHILVLDLQEDLPTTNKLIKTCETYGLDYFSNLDSLKNYI